VRGATAALFQLLAPHKQQLALVSELDEVFAWARAAAAAASSGSGSSSGSDLGFEERGEDGADAVHDAAHAARAAAAARLRLGRSSSAREPGRAPTGLLGNGGIHSASAVAANWGGSAVVVAAAASPAAAAVGGGRSREAADIWLMRRRLLRACRRESVDRPPSLCVWHEDCRQHRERARCRRLGLPAPDHQGCFGRLSGNELAEEARGWRRVEAGHEQARWGGGGLGGLEARAAIAAQVITRS